MKYKVATVLFIYLQLSLFCQIKVVTTTTVIYDLVKNIGGEKVDVQYLSRGDQDVHYLEILPSYMLKLNKADIFFKIGLELELWSYQLVDGSRNNSLAVVDLSKGITPKEVPTAKVDASQGDVHPYGNPHYWLDPENGKIIVREIFNALASESPEDFDYFKKNLDNYLKLLNSKIAEWNKKMEKVKGKELLFFHKSWIYFADRYGLKIAGYVEPKPGIPPTPSHNAEVINLIKKKGIGIIVMDVFYSTNAPEQIADITGVKVLRLPTQVFGVEKVKSYIDLLDNLVDNISKNI